MKSKTKDMIAVLIIQLIITLPFYTANVYGLSISNVRVTKVTSNSATIEWDTDEISVGRVKYGKTASLGFSQGHTNFVNNHVIIATTGVTSDSNYFFAVESTNVGGSTIVDDNSNNFYTFKTLDAIPPPQVIGLVVASSTSDSIFLTWDSSTVSDFDHYVVYREGIAIANSTTNSFNDTGLSPQASFRYKVSAVDTSNNEGSFSIIVKASTLKIDSANPVISNIDVLALTDTTARITWLTDENSSSVILYGQNKTDKTKSSEELKTNHSIIINTLTKGIKYFFIVKSCDNSNNCANSSLRNFTSGRDLIAPFINLTIPRYINRRSIDLIGSTEPFSSITIFVNDMSIPKRSLSNNEIGSTGKFVFSQLQLEQDNVIRVVAVDKSSNRNEKIFETSIDIQDPIIKLDEIPSLTSKKNLTISGTASEPVTIQVFLDNNINVKPVPGKIANVAVAKIGQNSVELHWDESKDKDFSHYVVYRQDIGPIAITKPVNFNLYIDALVDSDKNYAYQISQVNKFGEESEKSEPITVAIPDNGAILNLKPLEVDILEEFKKPVLIINTNKSFKFGIELDKDDTIYKLKLIFEDRAGNDIVIDKNVVLDTKKPEVKIISPPGSAFIYENVANEVDIIGTTEPNARVHLFIDRTPFSFFNESVEFAGLPNEAILPSVILEIPADELDKLPEPKLDAKCRLNVAGTSFCPTGADFSTSADNEGNFKFEKVDLTAMFGGAARLRSISPSDFRDEILNQESRESKKAEIVVIATDQVGQRGFAKQSISLGTCWSGNQSWDVIPLIKYQRPALLSAERFTEGTETLYFYFNYSYIGAGIRPIITGVSIRNACSRGEMIDPRFNISCKVMPTGIPTKTLNQEKTASFSAATLARYPGMDKFLDNDWKNFFKSINNEMTFPLKIVIAYRHDTDNDGELETETQTTCDQVTYVIDNAIIDPRNVLPDWLLFDFVDILKQATETVEQVNGQVRKLVDYVGVVCLASFGLMLGSQFYRRWVDFWIEKTYGLKELTKFNDIVDAFKLTQNTGGNEDECKKLITDIKDKKGSFQLRYVSDINLKKCFPESASAWDVESNTYSLFRWSCDRIFGHAAPAKWTENKNDDELVNKVNKGEGCAVDESVWGQGLPVESCASFASRYPRYAETRDPRFVNKKCTLVKVDKGKEAVFTVDEQLIPGGSNNLYKLTHIKGLGIFSGEYIYAVKKDEFNYQTKQTQSCPEICGAKGGKVGTFKSGDKEFAVSLTEPKKTILPQSTNPNDKRSAETISGCEIKSKCDNYNVNIGKTLYVNDGKNNLDPIEIKSATTRGYTSDCFYDENKNSPEVVSDNPATRVECCCINAKGSAGSTNYYSPQDKDPIDGKLVHESKSSGTTAGALTAEFATAEKYEDMKWSYRYWKERFTAIGPNNIPHTEYNKYRYIEGRDFSACFGQNNILYDGISGTTETVLTVDPHRDHWAAFQCVHLVGISQRLTFLNNLMSSLSTCLIQVRETGRGDSGACKEVFTQQVCGALWQIVRAIINKCSPVTSPYNFDDQSDAILNYLKAGVGGVSRSISDVQSSITQEYGNAKVNELVGTGEEDIARKICLGAFGYDWEINLKNLIDAAYATPFATFVQPITRSRELLHVDPITYKPQVEYRASWIINPGCNFDSYNVYLSCVGKKQIDQYPDINCEAVGAPTLGYTGPLPSTPLYSTKSRGYSQCDCINLPDERVSTPIAQGILRENVLEDKKAIHKVVTDPVRYDHLKFVLRADRQIPANVRPNCFPQGHDDGIFYFPITDKGTSDLFDCRVDYLSGSFICGQGAMFATKKGIAYFTGLRINDEDALKYREQPLTFEPGKPLSISVSVNKIGSDKCLKASLDTTDFGIVGITVDGTYQYDFDSPILSLGQRERVEKSPANSVDIIVISLPQILEDFSITMKFYDMNKNGIIDFDRIGTTDEDLISFEGNDRIPISKFGFDNNGRFMVTKNGAVIQITSVRIPKNIIGSQDFTERIGDNNIGFIPVTLTVKKAEESLTTPTSQIQTRTLYLRLYHIKEQAESYDGNPSNCNFNDQVKYPDKYQEIKIPIQISQTIPKDALLQDIRVAYPTTVNPGQIVDVSMRLAISSLVQNAVLTYTTPDGAQELKIFDRMQDGTFKVPIATDNFKKVGIVIGKIKITAQGREIPERDVKFEVRCGSANNYGLCDSTGKCCRDRNCNTAVITGGLECALPQNLPVSLVNDDSASTTSSSQNVVGSETSTSTSSSTGEPFLS